MFALHFMQSFDIFSEKQREVSRETEGSAKKELKDFSSAPSSLFFFFRHNYMLENITVFKSNRFLYIACFKEVISLIVTSGKTIRQQSLT